VNNKRKRKKKLSKTKTKTKKTKKNLFSISRVKGEEFNVPLFKYTQVKFQDPVTWISFLFIIEAGINLLGRNLMSVLGTGIKVAKKNFEISLNLMSTEIESQILPQVWTKDGNRGEWFTNFPHSY
jgi:hypothetical protein